MKMIQKYHPINTTTLEDIFSGKETGIIVSVFNNQAAILTFDFRFGGQVGFCGMGYNGSGGDFSSCRHDAKSCLSDVIKTESDFYIFESVSELAKVATEKGWR
jgi:hypothetical protein